jgi:hypothetical protein
MRMNRLTFTGYDQPSPCGDAHSARPGGRPAHLRPYNRGLDCHLIERQLLNPSRASQPAGEKQIADSLTR